MQRQLWQQAARSAAAAVAARSLPVRRILAHTQPIRAVAASAFMQQRRLFNRAATAQSSAVWAARSHAPAAASLRRIPFSAPTCAPAADSLLKPLSAGRCSALTTAAPQRCFSTTAAAPAAAATAAPVATSADAAASSSFAAAASTVDATVAAAAVPSAASLPAPLSSPPTESSPLPPASASPSGLVFRVLPCWTHPYLLLARVDKPVGTWLLLLPCLWSLSLAAAPGTLPDLRLAALLATGAFVMRGAGCTINDLWDRDFDRRVERTKQRPLAAGTVTVPAALGFLVLQLLLGLGVALQLSPLALAVSVASLPLVVAYPLAKRWTRFPQLVLGLTFNWGVWVGFACVHAGAGGTSASALIAALPQLLPLYIAGIAWTLVYDTVYAHQDTVDDAAIGLRSTALTFGAHSRTIMGALAAASVGAFAAAGAANGMGVLYASAVGGVALHYAWQLSQVDLAARASCHRMFLANVWLGAILLAGIVIDRVCAKPETATTKLDTEDGQAVKTTKPPTSWSVLRSYFNF